MSQHQRLCNAEKVHDLAVIQGVISGEDGLLTMSRGLNMVEHLATGVITLSLLVLASYIVSGASKGTTSSGSDSDCAFTAADYIAVIAIVAAVMAGVLIAPIYP
jgi:hypothetical protein